MDQVLKTRTITGIIFGIIVISLLLLGKWGITTLLGIVAIGGAYEYNLMAKKSNTTAFIGMAMALFVFIAINLVTIPDLLKDVLLGMLLVFYTFFMANVLSNFRLDHHKILPVFALVYPILALAIPLIWANEDVWSSRFWLYAVLLIWISDVGAYLVGRKLGKTKLLEKVSPKKTVEGSLGAGLFTILGGIIIHQASGTFSLKFWVITAVTIWIIGTFGDLYESTIKRKYDVKDSGTIMPGHGGFLDRFDSLIFAAPFLVLILKITKTVL
jgi:phosphatidate cytidylyltransferase